MVYVLVFISYLGYIQVCGLSLNPSLGLNLGINLGLILGIRLNRTTLISGVMKSTIRGYHETGCNMFRSVAISIICIILPVQKVTGQFTEVTPEGAVYDTRTHYYDAIQRKVFIFPELKSLWGEEKRQVYREMGLVLGGNDPERYREALEERERVLAYKRALRVQIAQQKARERRARISRPRGIYYYYWTWNFPRWGLYGY